MQDKNAKERRRYVRFIISIPLKFNKVSKDSLGVISNSTIDISAKGIGLIGIEELIVKTPIDIVLKMPDNGEEIPVKAEVVWIKKIDANKFRAGLMLKDSSIKPIPLVLRTLSARF